MRDAGVAEPAYSTIDESLGALLPKRLSGEDDPELLGYGIALNDVDINFQIKSARGTQCTLTAPATADEIGLMRFPVPTTARNECHL